MRKETLGFLQIITGAIIFAFTGIAVKFGKDLGAYNLSFFRVLLSAFFIYIFFLLFKKHKLVPFKYEKKKLLLFGVLHSFIILGSFLAYQLLSIALATLLIMSLVIWIIIFSYFILNEKITKTILISLIIAFTGVVVVFFPGKLSIKESLFGSIAALLAGIGAGAVYVLSKTFKKYDKVSLTFWQNLIAVPFFIPFIFNQSIKFTSIDILVLFFLGPLTALAFILRLMGFGNIAASKGGIFLLLYIPFAIIAAFFVLKEIPTINAIIGGILISIGAYIIYIKKVY